MTEFTTMPDGRTVLKADAEAIEHWIDFVLSMVVLYHAHTDDLIEATIELGRVAQAQYPQLESGGSAMLALADVDGLLDDFFPQYASAYVGITGTVLFACVDGPAVAANVLAEQIRFLDQQAWREVADANDGDS